MANNYPNFPYNQPQQINPTQPNINQLNSLNALQPQPNFFLQPIGNIYNLNTASEIGNVPAGANASVGLCLSENVMYIKSFQNGAPMLLGYRLSPIEGGITNEDTAEIISKKYDERFNKIEEQLTKIRERLGGKLEWQI